MGLWPFGEIDLHEEYLILLWEWLAGARGPKIVLLSQVC
jgi:hypothetical protein